MGALKTKGVNPPSVNNLTDEIPWVVVEDKRVWYCT